MQRHNDQEKLNQLPNSEIVSAPNIKSQMIQQIIDDQFVNFKKNLLACNKVDLNNPDAFTGWTPLTLAIVLNKNQFVEALLEHTNIDIEAPITNITEFSNTIPSNFDVFKISHLLGQQMSGYLKSFQMTLETRATNHPGASPFHLATLYNPIAAELLLKYNVNVNLLFPGNYPPPIITCLIKIRNRGDLFDKLIKYQGTNVNISNPNEAPSIFYAAGLNDTDTVKKLLSTNKVNMEIKHQGLTPWAYACQRGITTPEKNHTNNTNSRAKTLAAFIHHVYPNTQNKIIPELRAGSYWKYQIDMEILVSNIINEQSIETLRDVYEKINIETTTTANQYLISDEMAQIILSQFQKHSEFEFAANKLPNIIILLNSFNACLKECKQKITNIAEFIKVIENIKAIIQPHEVNLKLLTQESETKFTGVNDFAKSCIHDSIFALSKHYYSFFASLDKITEVINIQELSADNFTDYKKSLEFCYNRFKRITFTFTQTDPTIVDLISKAKETTKKLYFYVAEKLAEYNSMELLQPLKTHTTKMNNKKTPKKVLAQNNLTADYHLQLTEAVARLEKLKEENKVAEKKLEELACDSKDNKFIIEQLKGTAENQKAKLQSLNDAHQTLSEQYQLTLKKTQQRVIELDTVESSNKRLTQELESAEEKTLLLTEDKKAITQQTSPLSHKLFASSTTARTHTQKDSNTQPPNPKRD